VYFTVDERNVTAMNTKLAELRKTPHMSFSSFNDYIGCSLKYRFRKIDGLKSDSTSGALLLGSGIHSALEDHFNCLKEGEIIEGRDLEEIFELRFKSFVAGAKSVRYKAGDNFESLLAQGRGLIRVFCEKYEHSGERVLAVEEPFSINIPGIPVPVIGSIDLLLGHEDGSLYVIDHKTAAKAYSDLEIHGNQQLTLYQIAVKSMGYEDREIILAFNALIKTREPKAEFYYTTRSEADEQRLIRKLQETWKAIESGIFIPCESWMCGGCGYQAQCREWHLEEAA
jgi:putative RecB family exonuclease